MDTDQFFDILKQGKETWNTWRAENAAIHPDLRNLDLEGMDLREFNLSDCNLQGANLNKAKLHGTLFAKTDLRGASLHGAVFDDQSLREAKMSCDEHLLARLRQGTLSWNEWRKSQTPDVPNRFVLREADLQKQNLKNIDLSQADLIKVNFQGAQLQGADFSEADLSKADLSQAKLQGANFLRAHMRRARLSGADLRGANLREANLENADLRGAKLHSADLSKTNLNEADLQRAELEDVDLRKSTLKFADLRKAKMRNAKLSHAQLDGADMRGAELSGANLSSACLKAVDLSGADLSGPYVRGADLRDTNLEHADLRDANMREVRLRFANLKNANLIGATLISANMRKADLTNADLRRAKLHGANLGGTILTNANLDGAHMIGAHLSNREHLETQSELETTELAKYDWARKILDESEEGQITLKNQTARRIGISLTDSDVRRIVLPPFGERKLSLAEYEKYREDIEAWKSATIIKVEISHLELEHLRNAPQKLKPLPNHFIGRVKYWAQDAIRRIQEITRWIFVRSLPEVMSFMQQSFSLLINLLIGIGLPALVIHYFGGGKEFFSMDQQPGFGYLGRLLQSALIVVASLLPALLYFLFDRQKLGTLRENFYREVLQLDSKILTIDDAKSIYGLRVNEMYGEEAMPGEKKLKFTGTQLPVFVTTLLITIGWTFTLLPVGLPPTGTDVSVIYDMLVPQLSPICFGFLGAYFFAINMVVRRYTRADLKPKAYSHITVRFLSVFIIVWVLSVMPALWNGSGSNDPILLVLAFLIGIIPETGLTLIREGLQKSLGMAVPSLKERLPLTDLDGMTLYERARLLEEGIDNIENLVYHDLIDLMLQTRIPLIRLIDWVDQGILHLHAQKIEQTDASISTEYPITTLRHYGIRNASDLIEVYESAMNRSLAKKKDPTVVLPPDSTVDKFLAILNYPDGPNRMQIIFDAVQNDEWLSNILSWRERSRLPGEHIYSMKEMYMSFEDFKKRYMIADGNGHS